MDQQKEEAAGCAACNRMHRRCPPNCIFAPYFPVTSRSFDYVYHVYGCSNVGKILQSLPVEQRKRAAESLVFEAEARIRHPVLGCVGYIYLLQQHLAQIDRDIQEAETQISAAGPPAMSPPLEQHYWHPMPQLTAMAAPPYHEQPEDLLLVTGAATYPSIPKTADSADASASTR
ncbi:LOB domain-containing protein 24-like [Zingiber officinale]|uniref:LOB domain-containing protein n=1 Tax=Zingiber officinale TaxID=94328 RepID=A0A8J5LFG1_ZINOF|nr:LOB domain-containing protein 24-like [Zingiber officinale]KAG6510808.1 hypothetical protein ZIOFF_028847 [Zingiber officinale]